MAFSNTAVKTIPLGGGLRLEIGTWYGAQGDDDGTVSLRGGRVFGVQFLINDSDVMYDPVPVTYSVSAGVITVTVANIQTVESGYGTYFILYE